MAVRLEDLRAFVEEKWQLAHHEYYCPTEGALGFKLQYIDEALVMMSEIRKKLEGEAASAYVREDFGITQEAVQALLERLPTSEELAERRRQEREHGLKE